MMCRRLILRTHASSEVIVRGVNDYAEAVLIAKREYAVRLKAAGCRLGSPGHIVVVDVQSAGEHLRLEDVGFIVGLESNERLT